MNIINKMARELMFGRFPSNLFKERLQRVWFSAFCMAKVGEMAEFARIRPHVLNCTLLNQW